MEINERRPGDEKEDEGIEEDKFKLYGHVLKRITYKTYGDYNNTLLLRQRNPAALKPHQFFELLQANRQKGCVLLYKLTAAQYNLAKYTTCYGDKLSNDNFNGRGRFIDDKIPS